MDVLLVVCHPIAASFNHAIARSIRETLAASGHRTDFADLYADRFDPVMPGGELLSRTSLDESVSRYRERLERCGGLVVVHPDWWGWPPAVLVGWIDRVFRQGTAYEYEGQEFLEKRQVPLLSGRRAAVIVTTDRDPMPDGSEHPLAAAWRERILGFSGFERPEVRIVWSVRKLSAAARRKERLRAAALVGDW